VSPKQRYERNKWEDKAQGAKNEASVGTGSSEFLMQQVKLCYAAVKSRNADQPLRAAAPNGISSAIETITQSAQPKRR